MKKFQKIRGDKPALLVAPLRPGIGKINMNGGDAFRGDLFEEFPYLGLHKLKVRKIPLPALDHFPFHPFRDAVDPEKINFRIFFGARKKKFSLAAADFDFNGIAVCKKIEKPAARLDRPTLRHLNVPFLWTQSPS